MSELFAFAPEAAARQAALAKQRDRLKWRGHAAQPGTGPASETCKTCAHYAHVHHANAYRKCALRKGSWTGGAGTDIRAGDPACSKWERSTTEGRL